MGKNTRAKLERCSQRWSEWKRNNRLLLLLYRSFVRCFPFVPSSRKASFVVRSNWKRTAISIKLSSSLCIKQKKKENSCVRTTPYKNVCELPRRCVCACDRPIRNEAKNERANKKKRATYTNTVATFGTLRHAHAVKRISNPSISWGKPKHYSLRIRWNGIQSAIRGSTKSAAARLLLVWMRRFRCSVRRIWFVFVSNSKKSQAKGNCY